MSNLISGFWVILEIFCCHLFMESFLPRRVSKMHFFFIYLVFWASIFCWIKLAPFSFPVIWIFSSLLLFFSLYLFQGSFLQHLLVTLLCLIMFCISDTLFPYGTCSIMAISFDELTTRKLTYLTIVTTGKFFNILIAWLIHRFRKAGCPQVLHPQWILLSLLFPLISFIMLGVVFSSFKGRSDLSKGAFLFSIALFISNISVIYLIGIMEKNTEAKHEVALLNQQMDIQTQSILSLEKSYRNQRKSVHEFSHHLQTLDDLLAQKEYSTARDYIKQIQGLQTTRVFSVNSHHPIIDAILNSKYQNAKENNIDMQVQVNDLSAINLPTDALVVLLANLLDNAIEACQRYSGDRIIHCSLIASDTLFISIENTSLPVEIVDGKIRTSKQSNSEHGFGLINIRRIIQLLNAESVFNYSSGWFHFVAEIPIT